MSDFWTVAEIELLRSCMQLRKENNELRDLLRWREIGKEFPEESGAYIVANDTNCFIDYYSNPGHNCCLAAKWASVCRHG